MEGSRNTGSEEDTESWPLPSLHNVVWGPLLCWLQSPHAEKRALKNCVWSVPHIPHYPPSPESEITQMGIEQHK